MALSSYLRHKVSCRAYCDWAQQPAVLRRSTGLGCWTQLCGLFLLLFEPHGRMYSQSKLPQFALYWEKWKTLKKSAMMKSMTLFAKLKIKQMPNVQRLIKKTKQNKNQPQLPPKRDYPLLKSPECGLIHVKVHTETVFVHVCDEHAPFALPCHHPKVELFSAGGSVSQGESGLQQWRPLTSLRVKL